MFGAGREQEVEDFYSQDCEGKNRSQCMIPNDLSDAGPFSTKCRKILNERIRASRFHRDSEGNNFGQYFDKDVPEPVITVRALCVSDTIAVPYIDYPIEKDAFGLFIVIIDFCVIMSIMGFIHILEQRQLEYIEQFKRQTIQMSDFALRVKNLPRDSEYGDREHILKAYLWDHFQALLAREHVESGTDQHSAKKQNKKDAKETNHRKEHDIADITFGKQQIRDTAQLMKLYELSKKIQTLEFRRSSVKSKTIQERYQKELEEAQEAYQTEKAIYIHDKAKKASSSGKKDDKSVKYAYVIFRSMDDLNKVINAYNVSPFYRCCVLRCSECCCAESQGRLRKKYF